MSPRPSPQLGSGQVARAGLWRSGATVPAGCAPPARETRATPAPPVKILDHDDRRPSRRDLRQQFDQRFVQPFARLVWVELIVWGKAKGQSENVSLREAHPNDVGRVTRKDTEPVLQDLGQRVIRDRRLGDSARRTSALDPDQALVQGTTRLVLPTPASPTIAARWGRPWPATRSRSRAEAGARSRGPRRPGAAPGLRAFSPTRSSAQPVDAVYPIKLEGPAHGAVARDPTRISPSRAPWTRRPAVRAGDGDRLVASAPAMTSPLSTPIRPRVPPQTDPPGGCARRAPCAGRARHGPPGQPVSRKL